MKWISFVLNHGRFLWFLEQIELALFSWVVQEIVMYVTQL